MSGVYISGMAIPKRGCWDCRFGYDGKCFAVVPFRRLIVGESPKPIWCPLIPVPDHGRLIDADALHQLFEAQWHYLQIIDWNENPTAEAKQSGINWCINTMHDDAPTIIPGEDGFYESLKRGLEQAIEMERADKDGAE